MNSCCPDFSPERGCSHWGPEPSVSAPDLDYMEQRRRDDAETEEQYRRNY